MVNLVDLWWFVDVVGAFAAAVVVVPTGVLCLLAGHSVLHVVDVVGVAVLEFVVVDRVCCDDGLVGIVVVAMRCSYC